MAPTLLLIRHAQALHNVASDWSIHDPPLSKLGEDQCKELQESLKNSEIASQVELIVVSSMRRTLQTASMGLEWLIKDKGIKVLPDAGWQGDYSLRSSNRRHLADINHQKTPTSLAIRAPPSPQWPQSSQTLTFRP